MLTISNKGWLFTSILSALMAFTSLSTDIYLPAMPEMGRDLNGDAELTLTGFLIGFALAQLFWGAVSDKIGRKKPLIMGVVLFIIGSVGCALSSSTATSFWRLLRSPSASGKRSWIPCRERELPSRIRTLNKIRPRNFLRGLFLSKK